MTRILYERDTLCLTVEGHAGFGEAGQDIVCAGVSALTEALLRRVRRRSAWRPSLCVDRRLARVRVRLRPKDRRAGELAAELLETVCGGYRAIAEQYPDYVKVEVR